MKMLKVKSVDGEELYVNPNHIIFLRVGSYDSTKIIIDGMNVINSIEPIASVLLDLERIDYDKKEKK